jgi:hypothetical protein
MKETTLQPPPAALALTPASVSDQRQMSQTMPMLKLKLGAE